MQESQSTSGLRERDGTGLIQRAPGGSTIRRMMLYHSLRPHPVVGAGREVRMFLHEKVVREHDRRVADPDLGVADPSVALLHAHHLGGTKSLLVEVEGAAGFLAA